MIFDGIQRPLEVIAKQTKSMYIPKGINIPALDHKKLWKYDPVQGLKAGDWVTGGKVIGSVYENALYR